MTRSRTVSLFVVAVVATVASCGGGPSGGDCVDRASPDPAYQHLDGNGTYAGASCIEANCHLVGSLGPQAMAFHVGGTVYQADETTPQAGATVRFESLDGNGPIVAVVTDEAGNFFIPTSQASPFPAIPSVSACPDSESMIEGAFDPSYGSCAVQSCHSRSSGGRGPIVLGN
jgi:hypothetical protein